MSFLVAGCGPGSSNTDAGGPASTCAPATGPGVTHADTVSADTTWRAADSPHQVTFGFSVAKGATLTIEPCAEVRMGSYGITVNGRLVAQGAPTRPIRIAASDPQEPFSYIRTFGGEVQLAWVTLENGGNAQDPNGLGVIDVRGDGSSPRQELLRVDHVTIKGSQQYGVSLRSGGTFTADSTALAISGAALGPIRTSPRLAGNIPPGSYTGNSVDVITVVADEALTEDTTLHDRGVPYRVGDAAKNGGDLRIGKDTAGAARTALTVEAGVAVRFIAGGRILMSATGGTSGTATGALIVSGSAARPVVFTSAAPSPAPGDWVGLWFDGTPDPYDRIDFARVEYAGGPSFAKSYHCDLNGGLQEEEDAAIIFLGKPSASFITNTTITNSAGYGIDRGWRGDPMDLTATNTFSQIAKCKQSYPRAQDGSCPATVTCN